VFHGTVTVKSMLFFHREEPLWDRDFVSVVDCVRYMLNHFSDGCEVLCRSQTVV